MVVSLSTKADKTYVDEYLALKAYQATTYTKTEVDTALALKANEATTYSKTEVDSIVSPTADNTNVDTHVALKANQSNTYTKTEVYTALAGKQPTITTTTSLSLASITKTGTITASKFISKFLEPPVSCGNINIRGDLVSFGRAAFMSASPVSLNMNSLLRTDKGLRVSTGITSGYVTDCLNPLFLSDCFNKRGWTDQYPRRAILRGKLISSKYLHHSTSSYSTSSED